MRAARSLLILLVLGVNACISNPLRWDNNTHVVQRGETLVAIALRYEVRTRDLTVWNGLANPDQIYPGQKLRVTPPPGWNSRRTSPSTAAAGRAPVVPSPSVWFWPANGALVPNRNFAGVGDGINISSQVGDPVFAASEGKVVYSGNGLKGYGNLLIIKHNDTYLSAYGFNQRLLVSEGEQVKGGQRIAQMGLGPGQTAMLHFEIRKNGKPVDPLKYLKKQ
ncbi:MAG: peptidoglycan DD-metalloendopeptidase family protein [Gammaproteobacteria bacterium]|nr:peptidoglycan DD-metalloendopeptidase family protein [Gammaproteobacteria bacterium]